MEFIGSPVFVLRRLAPATIVLTVLVQSEAAGDARLLPFQGRLTDATGASVPDGAKTIEFKMYDAPTGGAVKWAGEVHKLSVNGGLVNTMLGSKASLAATDFAASTYLQITVDANGDNQITAADPPLLPRQSVVPAVYAAEAEGLKAGDGRTYGWSALFGAQSPLTGKIGLERLAFQDGSLPASAIAANNGITAAQLGAGAVETSEIKDQAVTLAKLAPRALSPNAALEGAIGISDLAEFAISSASPSWIDVGTLQVTLRTTGRPVWVGITSSNSAPEPNSPPEPDSSYIQSQAQENHIQFWLRFSRDGQGFGSCHYKTVSGPAGTVAPPGMRWAPTQWAIDHPSAGDHTYKLQLWMDDPLTFRKIRLVAYEL